MKRLLFFLITTVLTSTALGQFTPPTSSNGPLMINSVGAFATPLKGLNAGTNDTLRILIVGQSNYNGIGGDWTDEIYPPSIIDPRLFGAGITNCFKLYREGDTRRYPTVAAGLTKDVSEYRIYSTTQIQPDDHMAYAISSLYDELYVTKVVKGGTTISEWLKSANDLWPFITNGVNEMATIEGSANDYDIIIWGQGESDKTTPESEYLSNFRQMISDLRADFCVTNAPVIISGMGGDTLDGGSGAQSAFEQYITEDPYAILVDASDLALTDVHYNNQELVTLGYRLASAVVGLSAGVRTTNSVYAARSVSAVDLQSRNASLGTIESHLQTIDEATVITRLEEPFRVQEYYEYDNPSGQNQSIVTGYDVITQEDLYDSTNTGQESAVKVRGVVFSGAAVPYSRSVQLVANSRCSVEARYFVLEFDAVGGYKNGTDLTSRTRKYAQYNSTGSGFKSDFYGDPNYPSDNLGRWIITFNENVTISEGDTVQCGASTYFIADEGSTGTNMVVREHWNTADTTASGYTPVSTNTPVIVEGVTNATAAVASSNVAEDYQDVVYFNSIGIYTIPTPYTQAFYEITMPTLEGWTPDSGL